MTKVWYRELHKNAYLETEIKLSFDVYPLLRMDKSKRRGKGEQGRRSEEMGDKKELGAIFPDKLALVLDIVKQH